MRRTHGRRPQARAPSWMLGLRVPLTGPGAGRAGGASLGTGTGSVAAAGACWGGNASQRQRQRAAGQRPRRNAAQARPWLVRKLKVNNSDSYLPAVGTGRRGGGSRGAVPKCPCDLGRQRSGGGSTSPKRGRIDVECFSNSTHRTRWDFHRHRPLRTARVRLECRGLQCLPWSSCRGSCASAATFASVHPPPRAWVSHQQSAAACGGGRGGVRCVGAGGDAVVGGASTAQQGITNEQHLPALPAALGPSSAQGAALEPVPRGGSRDRACAPGARSTGLHDRRHFGCAPGHRPPDLGAA